MCKVRYLHKVGVSKTSGEGFELEVEVCDNPEHDQAFVKELGRRALEANKIIRTGKLDV